jgi:hypothetical protein
MLLERQPLKQNFCIVVCTIRGIRHISFARHQNITSLVEHSLPSPSEPPKSKCFLARAITAPSSLYEPVNY